MQSITDLHSSVYLTAIGMSSRHHHEDPFDELDGERPKPTSVLARIKSQFFQAIPKMRKLYLRPQQQALADQQLRTGIDGTLAFPLAANRPQPT